MVRAFVALGSNINPAENFRAALHALARRFERVEVSTVYRSEAEGRPEQPPFYNCVVAIETEMDPLDLKFRVLRTIEAELGRRRTSDKYAPRTIDLDLIVYGDMVLEMEEIVLPDPEISTRPFLSIPLAELAPDLTIRGTGASITHLAEAFPKNSIEPLHSYTSTMREEVSRIQNAANSGDS
jgi:dihydroneopterin aldolase/2-amino-4-hydroxy-6-hydroxymethyldihydropteridine diphosphokinase